MVNDTFAFLPGGSVSGSLKGGKPTNTLDYSQYGSPVTVNLATKTATGLGGTWARFIRILRTRACKVLDRLVPSGVVLRFPRGGFQHVH